MAFTMQEKSHIQSEVAAALSNTRFACSSLDVLSGGTANFLFRGKLEDKLGNGEDTVVIKHVRGCVAANKEFEMDETRCVGSTWRHFLSTSRCIELTYINNAHEHGNLANWLSADQTQEYEVAMLKSLATLEVSTQHEEISIHTPRVYHFDQKTNTQVLQDLKKSIDLKTSLVSNVDHSISLLFSSFNSLGHTLGSWLSNFHTWTSTPDQLALRKVIAGNQAMRDIRYKISYGAFCDIVEKYEDIWKEYSGVLEAVRDRTEMEYLGPFTRDERSGEVVVDDWAVIHGDFWSGNILIPDESTQANTQKEGNTSVFVIDWELAQLGPRAYDLGQFIGDLYERYHFSSSETALCIIRDFISGYGIVKDAKAYRVAIHAGQHLICWHIRRDPKKPFVESEDVRREAVRIGVEWIVRAWRGEREWFERSLFAGLFGSRKGEEFQDI